MKGKKDLNIVIEKRFFTSQPLCDEATTASEDVSGSNQIAELSPNTAQSELQNTDDCANTAESATNLLNETIEETAETEDLNEADSEAVQGDLISPFVPPDDHDLTPVPSPMMDFRDEKQIFRIFGSLLHSTVCSDRKK